MSTLEPPLPSSFGGDPGGWLPSGLRIVSEYAPLIRCPSTAETFSQLTIR
jgi:hypothetical protein